MVIQFRCVRMMLKRTSRVVTSHVTVRMAVLELMVVIAAAAAGRLRLRMMTDEVDRFVFDDRLSVIVRQIGRPIRRRRALSKLVKATKRKYSQCDELGVDWNQMIEQHIPLVFISRLRQQQQSKMKYDVSAAFYCFEFI